MLLALAPTVINLISGKGGEKGDAALSNPNNKHHSVPTPPEDTTEVSGSIPVEVEAVLHAPNFGLGAC